MLSGLYQESYDTFIQWSRLIETAQPEQDFADLIYEYDNLNLILEQVHTDDVTHIQDLNDLYNTYNNLSQSDIDSMGGEAAALMWLNAQIDIYNDYAANRPDVQALIDDIIAKAEAYNVNISELNTRIENINSQREAIGLAPYDLLTLTPVPDPDPLHITLSPELSFTSPLLPAVPRSTIQVPNPSQKGTIDANFPEPPGALPVVTFAEIKGIICDPFIVPILSNIGTINDIIDSARIVIEEESLFLDFTNFDILFSSGVFANANPAFSEALLSSAGGAGFISLIFGPHSNKVEIILSFAIMMTISQNKKLPISSRAFARLLFSALDILHKSSLLSANRAALTLAPILGLLAGSSSRAIDIAIALGFVNVTINLVNSNVSRSLVNSFINRIAFEVRTNERFQLNQVVLAERLLGAAIDSGNPGFIRFALNVAVKDSLKLEFLTKLFNTLGLQSIGGLAEFTKNAASTLNITFLTVALAQLGRSIGLPAIVPQLFANISNLSIADILTALTAGSQIIDYLDNPINILFLKQTLLDTVVYRLGLSSTVAVNLINTALNNVISKGSINNFSHLRAELFAEFEKVGFDAFQTNLLANETTALIRGDIGVMFLNAAFGINFDKGFIATSIVKNIEGSDIGLSSAMLSTAILRSILYGGFGSQVQLQSDLIEDFMALGLSEPDATQAAKNMADLIATLGVLVPLNQFPGLTAFLTGDKMLRAIVFGEAISRDEILKELQNQGISVDQSELFANLIADIIKGDFTSPTNLFELSLVYAFDRALEVGGFQTQREFRDELYDQLRAVGFSANDAMFVANSMAAFGLDGEILPLYGASNIAAITGALSSKASEEFGITAAKAKELVDEALGSTLNSAPFSSSDVFNTVLKEEFVKAAAAKGYSNAAAVFEGAMASLAEGDKVLNLAGLIEQISAHIQGALKGDAGGQLAKELQNQILTALFGGTTVDEIENEETKKPLSLLHQIDDLVKELLKEKEEEELINMLKRLNELLASISKPNASIGWMFQSLMDNPTTFISNLAMASQMKRSVDIPI